MAMVKWCSKHTFYNVTQTHGAVSGKKTVTRGGRGKGVTGGTRQAGHGAAIGKKSATATSTKVQCSPNKGLL